MEYWHFLPETIKKYKIIKLKKKDPSQNIILISQRSVKKLVWYCLKKNTDIFKCILDLTYYR